MMTTIPFILLALLCCAMGCTATGFPEFRCMHDEVMKNSGAMPARIVEPGPDKSGVQGAAKAANDPAWEAIRFKVFSEDLNSESRYCTAEGQMRPTFNEPSQTAKCAAIDILTNEKKSQLVTSMIPSALKLHSDRLLVQRLTGNIEVPIYSRAYCGAFTIPQSHGTVGVAGADMVMYVAAGPTGSPRAWAGICSRSLMNRRPIVGVMNVGPAMISENSKSIRIAAHEVGHAIGFDFDTMNSLKMLSNIADIRGHKRSVVSSNVTLRKTKAHYNCDSIAGMELENEGGSGTALSHWERRNARDELMAGMAGVGYYTALTMAAFEDQGYYRANWGKEETMEWGRNAGCPFLKEKCVNNGKTNYPDMFCTEVTSASVCTFGRRGLGSCTIHRYVDPFPVEFQYFADPTLGGTDSFFDFCPIVEQYSNTGCTDGNPSVMFGSIVGPNSVCLKGEGLRMMFYSDNAVQDICAEVSCENNTVRVRYAGDDAWHPCPEGSKITPGGSFTAGKIVCPRYAEICSTNLHPGDNGINEKIDNKFDSQTTTAIPSHDDDPLSKGHDSAHDGNGDASPTTTPSAVVSLGEKGSSGTGGVDLRKRSENGGASASTGATKTVGSTDGIVDSSQYPKLWYGSFIPLCVSFVHIYILLVF